MRLTIWGKTRAMRPTMKNVAFTHSRARMSRMRVVCGGNGPCVSASFVTSATLFRTSFVAHVIASETAGNAKGGGGGTYLRRLYRKAWNLISAKYVPLGANPF